MDLGSVGGSIQSSAYYRFVDLRTTSVVRQIQEFDS